MENYGIVVWADSLSGSLIIWCEDSGELAFAASEVARSAHDCGVGDLVGLVFETDCPGRRVCSQVVRKRKNAAPELVRVLKQQARSVLTGSPGRDGGRGQCARCAPTEPGVLGVDLTAGPRPDSTPVIGMASSSHFAGPGLADGPEWRAGPKR